MTPIDPPPCPVGIHINGIVAARVRALVDEYGETVDRDDAGRERRRSLGGLLRAVLRSLRLESVDGKRYRVRRLGDALTLECRDAGTSGPAGGDR
jgi:hypothetical protein